MSLDKAIKYGKEWRKEYCRENGTYAKAVSRACRNHGGCQWCLENRIHKYRKKEEAAKLDRREWLRFEDQEVLLCRI